ncbi:uncharacterized protein N7483_010484 [Penicillium malachiteum]|uniref:uncharacterized protein n=1 Tax=Penicillium malachiteum TaxID=1324776 RepID=UPI0025496F79|nr:uncharacterized protein N7483_010484 [Penicillium malachiteum]KAJ5713303.1 hypothetical protein N7483_010484 [Penicillium malachiteum]
MCSSSPLPQQSSPGGRRPWAQLVIAGVGIPFAIASITITTITGLEAWIQIIMLFVSVALSISLLYTSRGTSKDAYSPVGMVLDAIMTILCLITYIAGMIGMAKVKARDISWDFAVIGTIPQVCANLSCLLLAALHAKSFLVAFYHRFIQHRIRWNPLVTHVVCPSCSRTANPVSNLDWSADAQQVNVNNVYRDEDVEAQMPKQETGVVSRSVPVQNDEN